MGEKKTGTKVLGDFVLVRQIMKKKNRAIILDAAADDREKFDYYFEVVQKGAECKRDFEVGESPIFSQYVQFSGLKVIEKTENGMESIVIVNENDILGIDYDAVPISIAVGETKSKLEE